MRLGVDPGLVRDISDAIAEHLVAVPRPGEGICQNCHTWLPDAEGEDEVATECENCLEVRDALARDPLRLITVSLYRKPSTLRDILTRYKGRGNEEDPYDPAQVDLVRALLGRFLLDCGDRLTQEIGQIDALVVVPSTERPPPHPLEQIVRSLALDTPTLSILRRGPGDMNFRRPHPEGFLAQPTSKAMRILLLDDVYTTGARLNSAAAALATDGHHVAGAVVLARRINPDYDDAAARFWEAATSRPFDWKESPWS